MTRLPALLPLVQDIVAGVSMAGFLVGMFWIFAGVMT